MNLVRILHHIRIMYTTSHCTAMPIYNLDLRGPFGWGGSVWGGIFFTQSVRVKVRVRVRVTELVELVLVL